MHQYKSDIETREPRAGQCGRECDLEERGETTAREESREQPSSGVLGNDTLTSQAQAVAARRPRESYLHNRL